MKPGLKELILASFSFDEYNPFQTKTLILNTMLFITLVVNIILFPINTWVLQNPKLTSINIILLLIMSYALYQLREKNNYTSAAYIGTFSLFSIFIALILMIHGESFSLIWSYFFAPFVMITLGARRGLFLSLLFLSIIAGICYSGINTWQDGKWDTISYIRFMLAHFVMLYIMYAIVNSNEKANEKIESLRQKEQAQLKLFEKLSITDPLTSLYNRRSLKEIFPREFYNTKRNRSHIAYFLMDLDYFKSYNDTYGHKKGDEVLISVAEILKEHTPYGFRIGGDEFAGIIIGKEPSDFSKTLDRIKDALENLKLENKHSPVSPYLSCSIGIHIIRDEEYDFEEIYLSADTALYKAKALGRNQIVYL
jgi:diguanylate cyclase (GGDEF)-like protein